MSDDKGEVVSFSSAKAEATGDCRDWTPLDALKETVRQIESGELKPDMIYIAMREVSDDGKTAYWPGAMAGGTAIEITGLLAQHMHRQVSDE